MRGNVNHEIHSVLISRVRVAGSDLGVGSFM